MYEDSKCKCKYKKQSTYLTVNSGSYPLLVQVSLTVSPFVSLPTATTLPYQYQSLPSSLPPSSIDDPSGDKPSEKPKFVVSSSGQTAHPDDILASCQKLQDHIEKVHDEARSNVDKWESNITKRELAEKRRVAPGWLDSNERILQPATLRDHSQHKDNSKQKTRMTSDQIGWDVNVGRNREAEDLDRAFGSIKLQ